MAPPRIGNDALQMVVNAAAMHPDQRTAARAIGINYGTFKSRLALAHDRGLEPSVAMPVPEPPPEAVPTPQRRAPDSFESAWAVFTSDSARCWSMSASHSSILRTGRFIVER